MGGFRGKITVTAVSDSDQGQWSNEDRLIYAGTDEKSWDGKEDNDDYVLRLLMEHVEQAVKQFHAEHEGMFYGEPTVHRG